MSRKEVLALYKRLHKIASEVFLNDFKAQAEAKSRLRIEFKKNKNLEEQEKIAEKMKIGEDVGRILQTQVVQMVKKPETNSYELKIRKETSLLKNEIFREDAILPPPRSSKCKDSS